MTIRTSVCLAVAAVALAPLRLTAGDSPKFRHMVSIYADDGGAGFSRPEGVACGPNGEMVIGDTGNNRLVRLTYNDKAATGSSIIQVPELSAPSRLFLNSSGDIYALDSRRRRIVRLGPDGVFKHALAFAGAPLPATVIPRAFTIDRNDNIYVLDVFSARILVLDAEDAYQRALRLPAEVGFGSDLAVDAAGRLLLLDSINRRLFSAAPDASGFAPLGGDLAGPLATLPASLTVSRGSIFIVEGEGSSVVSLGLDGEFVVRQLSFGWEEGALNHPAQMCVNDRDEVFIADRDNSRIQVFQLIR